MSLLSTQIFISRSVTKTVMSPKRIEALRVKLGLTQAGLAEIVGCFQASVARWEGGRAEWTARGEPQDAPHA